MVRKQQRSVDAEPWGLNAEALANLSPREDQVLSLAAAGFLDKQIGLELGVSLNTLRTYWTRIRSKIGEAPRSALAVAYVQQLTRSAVVDEGAPDWEIDLERRVLRKLADRKLFVDLAVGQEMPLSDVFSRYLPEDRERAHQMIENVDRNGLTAFTFTARVTTQSGPQLAGAFIRVIRGENGSAVKLIGWHAPLVDLRSIPDGSLEPVRHDGWVVDVESGMVLASDSVNHLHGLESGVQHPRERYLDLFHPEDIPRWRVLMEDVIQGLVETGNITVRVSRTEGQPPILITLHGVRDDHGKVIKVIGYRTQLTDASGKAAKSTGRSQLGFWAKNLRSGSFITPDEEFCSIYRVDPESPTLDQDIPSRYDPADAEAAYAFIDEAVAEGKSRGYRDFRLVFEDGSQRRVRLEFFIENDEDGPCRANGTVLVLE